MMMIHLMNDERQPPVPLPATDDASRDIDGPSFTDSIATMDIFGALCVQDWSGIERVGRRDFESIKSVATDIRLLGDGW